MTNLAHSPLGPSSAERWLACPGSVRLTEHVVEIPSRYAAEGTLAHWVAHQSLATGNIPQMYLGHKATVDGFEFEVDQEMCAAVRDFLDHMNDLPPGVDFSETRVHYEEWVPGGFGTLDRARATEEVVYIRDFKFGQGVKVSAINNPQLKLYAAGFLSEYGWMFSRLKTFNLGVVQPRIGHIEEWEISLEDLMTWLKEVVVPGAKLTTQKNAPIRAGAHCQFCKIRSTCMVRANSMFAEVVGDFENLDAAIKAVDEIPLAKEQADALGTPYLTPDQIAHALLVLPQIESWCADLKEHAMRELQQGRAIGGWFLTAGRSNRTWGISEDDLLRLALEEGVHDPKLLYAPAKLLTPPALEKVLGKKHPLLTKAGVVSKPLGKPVLAPPGDSRPPLSATDLNRFEDLGVESAD